MSHVVITQNRVDIGVAISDALAGIALEPLVADKIVAVKPNETWASRDDTTGIGHPAMIGTRPLGGRAVAVRHLWEAARLGIGESDLSRMSFPNLQLREAIEAFSIVAYGERLTFEHE
jgi:hypothetical protein